MRPFAKGDEPPRTPENSCTAGNGDRGAETDLLNGQKLQGTGTAKDVMTCIKKLGCEKDFPLFCAIHKIAFEGAKPESIVDLYK